MMREIFPFLTAAGLLLILAFTAILLVRKRMQRGEIVQAVVKKAEINDSDPNGSTLVTLTYCFFLGRKNSGNSAETSIWNFAAQ